MRIFTAISSIRYYWATIIFLLAALHAFGQVLPVAVAGSNAPLCAGAVNLLLTETGGAATTWSWSGPNGFTSTAQNPVIPNPTPAAGGAYAVTITNAAGVQATDMTVVTIVNPTVNPVVNQVLCNGATTLPIVFSGNLPGTQFSWTNTNSEVGLPVSGTGNIAAFQTINTKTIPDTAFVNVIPQYTINGMTCTGAAQAFSLIVLPSPVVNTDPTVAICIGGSTPLHATGGISCSWQPAAGLTNPNTCNPIASPVQNTTYTVTVTAASGCTNTATVAVNIHLPQALACNNLVNVSLDQSGQVMVTSDMLLQGGTADEEVFTVKITNATGQTVANPVGCAQSGQILTVTITDECSNLSCWGNLRVEDKLAPQLTCHNLDLSCAITNYAPAYLDLMLHVPNTYPTVQENCGTFTRNYVDTWTDLSCTESVNGITDLSAYAIRRWTVTDAHGNSATCNQYIYFRRIHLGELIMPMPDTVTCVNPNISPAVTGAPHFIQYGQTFVLYPNTSFCELNAVYADLIIQICDGTFKIRRTWTIYEWCLPTSPANPMIYIQMITVADKTGPQFVCPANLTVNTNPVACCAAVDLPDVVLLDNCSRVHDIRAIVDVHDHVSHQITASYAVSGTLTNFPGNNLESPDTLGALALTPCLPASKDSVIVTYTATDDCGNAKSCSFQLTVNDDIPPTAVCQQSTTVALGVDGMVSIDAAVLDAGSFDNCGPVSFKVRRMNTNNCQSATMFRDQVKFCCSDVGNTVTVVLRVYDALSVPAGNVSLTYEEDHSNSCMVQVLVQDKIKPVCIAPSDVVVQCENFDPSLGVYGAATITDNCCLDTVIRTVNYSQFDTVCSRGTIVRTFQAFDCSGQSSSCTQRIVVNYNQNYYLKLPDDKIVMGCDGSGNYGAPSFFGQDCELLATSYTDQLFTLVPDACYKIERTWTIINWCTYNPNAPCINIPNPEPSSIINSPNNIRAPVISPPGTTGIWAPTVVNLTPNSPTPTDFSTFWSANANCYTYKQIIKILDTQNPVIDSCPSAPVKICDFTTNSPLLWNDPLWYEPATGSHDLCEGPADLSIAAFDSCSGLNVTAHYLLFFDLDNDGVMETVVNSEQPPAPGIVNFGNALTPNFAGGQGRTFDQRNVPTSGKYRFTVQEQTNADSTRKIFSLRFDTPATPSTYTVPELPYGNYKIKWFVADGCSNEVACEYNFSIKDCKPPTVTCLNGLSINIMPTQMVQVWALDFLLYSEDNCMPSNLLKYGLRRVGQGTGFPTDANGQPQTSVVFTCADLGAQPVELWSVDLAGNADYCTTFVTVQDNNNNCPVGPAAVAGQLATETGDGLEEGTVTLMGTDSAANAFNYQKLSDSNGDFAFYVSVPPGSNLTVMPTKDDNPLNGVTTYDLVLISKHILGLQPISTPYRMIAADANKSGSITAFDIIEFRKLILGIYQELPNNTSWRFVDKDYVFPQPTNPFIELFPEYKTVSNFQPPVGPFDFVAIKVGDVNGSAFPNGLVDAEDRANENLVFEVTSTADATPQEEEEVQAGETFTVKFQATEAVQGYQFTLQYPGLEVLEIQPGAAMKADNFAIFPAEQTFTTAWEGGGQAEFSVRFRARQSGELSQMLHLSSRPTRAEAYAPVTGERLDIALKFHENGSSSVAGVGFELYQNEPNPFASCTAIGFHLPHATAATLTITDVTGRICWTQQGDFAQGYHRIVLDGSVLPASGLYYYCLETGTDMGTGKMIWVR